MRPEPQLIACGRPSTSGWGPSSISDADAVARRLSPQAQEFEGEPGKLQRPETGVIAAVGTKPQPMAGNDPCAGTNTTASVPSLVVKRYWTVLPLSRVCDVPPTFPPLYVLSQCTVS